MQNTTEAIRIFNYFASVAALLLVLLSVVRRSVLLAAVALLAIIEILRTMQ